MNGSSATDAAAAAQADGSVGIAPGELHPGGILVQNRSDAVSGPRGNLVKIKVLRGTQLLDVSVPVESTFGELKKVLEKETGLEPHEQRLLFRGKEKDDDDCLRMAGIKDMSKVVLLEDPVSKARKFEQMKRDLYMKKAYDAIAAVRAEVDKLATKVSALEAAVHSSTKADAKDFAVLTELLMMQLLKLDGIEAEGEAKMQRKSEVRRIQNIVETLDSLKALNSNPFIDNNSSAVSMTTSWETFDSGSENLNASFPNTSSAMITNDWEHFD
ncbi:BAG family molecular chaperone regulator 4-like [Zingiber officinale]|uniref:BAG family molecular chaperone regulator 4-like n=1 Tax=Zingiber officinale TaxID=94328 RepID=UPI001C4C0F89|nr:BAG family molecular chaperone regulator 4-like [Zingiber officinale]